MKTEHNEQFAVANPATSRMGQLAYEAYCNAVSHKTHDGKDTPAWDKLEAKSQIGWVDAARAVATECINGRYKF